MAVCSELLPEAICGGPWPEGVVMNVVVKGEKVIAGDCVMLSCRASAGLLRVQDVDGCQIRLDGEVRSVEGEWCQVFVKCEVLGRRDGAYLVKTRMRDVELTSEVHEWRKVTAKQIDRVRRYGNDECEFWAPLGESSF